MNNYHLCRPIDLLSRHTWQDSETGSQNCHLWQANTATPGRPKLPPVAEEQSIYQSTYQEEALEENIPTDVGTLHPRERVRRLWSDDDELIPSPADEGETRRVLSKALCVALGLRPNAPSQLIAAETRCVPEHVVALVIDDMMAGRLTMTVLAEQLVRHGAVQRERI